MELFESYYDQICKGRFFESFEILKLKDEYNHLSLAHEQVKRGWKTDKPRILKIRDRSNMSVAHYQAERGWTTEDSKLLQLRVPISLRTLAHFQVTANCLKAKVEYKPGKHCREVTREKWFTEEPKILTLVDYAGWSVAHLQAIWGWTTEDPEILFIENIFGDSVAYLQMQRGWRPTSPTIKRRLFVKQLTRN